MPRSLPEWKARNDDQSIPDRVKDRIAEKANKCCQICKRPVGGKLKPEFDHITPLILGGKHAESNLRLLCSECHCAKTALDVRLKAKVARVRQKHLGIKRPKQTIKSRGFERAPPQRTASRPINRPV